MNGITDERISKEWTNTWDVDHEEHGGFFVLHCPRPTAPREYAYVMTEYVGDNEELCRAFKAKWIFHDDYLDLDDDWIDHDSVAETHGFTREEYDEHSDDHKVHMVVNNYGPQTDPRYVNEYWETLLPLLAVERWR